MCSIASTARAPLLKRKHRCSDVMNLPQKVWAPSPSCKEGICTFLAGGNEAVGSLPWPTPLQQSAAIYRRRRLGWKKCSSVSSTYPKKKMHPCNAHDVNGWFDCVGTLPDALKYIMACMDNSMNLNSIHKYSGYLSFYYMCCGPFITHHHCP